MTTKKPTSAAPQSAALTGAPRIVDVAHPNQLPAADATARPLIVSNRVVLRDPMVTAKPEPVKARTVSPEQSSQPSDQAVAVSPEVAATSSVDTDADGMTGPSIPVAAKPNTSTEHSKPRIMPSGQIVDTPVNDPKPTSTSDANVDDESIALETKATRDEAALAADAKLQDELDGLVEKKQYFLPINAVEKRRSQHIFIFGTILILVLGLAWLNIAMDAGFVSVPGVRPVTHLFHN